MDWSGPEVPEVPGVLGPGAPAPPGDDPGPGAPVPVEGGDAGVPLGVLEGVLVGVELGGLDAGGELGGLEAGGELGGLEAGGGDGELEGPRAAKAGHAVVLTVVEQSFGRLYTLVLFTVVLLLLLSSPTAVHRQVGSFVLRLENTVQQAADGDASEPATYV